MYINKILIIQLNLLYLCNFVTPTSRPFWLIPFFSFFSLFFFSRALAQLAIASKNPVT